MADHDTLNRLQAKCDDLTARLKRLEIRGESVAVLCGFHQAELEAFGASWPPERVVASLDVIEKTIRHYMETEHLTCSAAGARMMEELVTYDKSQIFPHAKPDAKKGPQ